MLASALAAGVALGAESAGPSGPVSTVAGTGTAGFNGDGLVATAQLRAPRGVAALADGSLLVADTANHRIRRVADGTVVTVAGTGTAGGGGDGALAALAGLNQPVSVAPLADGGFLIADRATHRIRKVDPLGLISTVAGTGDEGDGNDGEPATSARLDWPNDVSPTADGGFLIADTRNNRIRKVRPNGVMRIVAGDGGDDFEGDGGPARSAELNNPRGVAALPDGGFLVADTGNHRIRRVAPDGTITTVAGKSVSGYAGEHVPATAAKLQNPADVALAPSGGFVIADWKNHRVRYVSPEGIIRTLAGTGVAAFSGDGGPAGSAALNEPRGVAVLGGDVLVSDKLNHRIRRFAAEILPAATAPGSGAVPPPSPPPAPAAGRRLLASPVRGDVAVKPPGARRFVDLATVTSVPVGSVLDAREGAVRVTSAANLKGRPQAAVFQGAAFRVDQRRRRRPVTQIALRGGSFRGCRARARRSTLAGASRRRRARRGLWGRGHGRFRTRGRHGAATVRGTVWFTGDRCNGTLVRVKRGVVAVEDFARDRRVLVKAGRNYLARRGARGRRSR